MKGEQYCAHHTLLTFQLPAPLSSTLPFSSEKHALQVAPPSSLGCSSRVADLNAEGSAPQVGLAQSHAKSLAACGLGGGEPDKAKGALCLSSSAAPSSPQLLSSLFAQSGELCFFPGFTEGALQHKADGWDYFGARRSCGWTLGRVEMSRNEGLVLTKVTSPQTCS